MILKEQRKWVINPNKPNDLAFWETCIDTWKEEGYEIDTDSTVAWTATLTEVYTL